MPSVLDDRIRGATDQLTGPGGQMQLTVHRQYGVDVPMIAVAPPALTHYFAYFCAEHANECFIVDGTERLTYAQAYAAARAVAGGLVEGYGVKRGDRIGIAMRNAPGCAISRPRYHQPSRIEAI